MPKLALETRDREKPLLLVAGKSQLTSYLIEKSSDDFKIAYLSDEQIPTSVAGSEHFYRIGKDSAHLIASLEEKIDYAVIFLESTSDKDFLPALFEKLSSDNTKTAVMIPVQKTDVFVDVMLEYKKNPSFYFLILGDVYSESGSDQEVISGLIKNAITNHIVKLTGDDLTPIFPIYLEDALTGINQVLLGPSKRQKFYWLFYSHPQTIISATHILKRVESDLEIQYEDEETALEKRLRHEEIEENLAAKILTKPVYLDKYFMGFEKSVELFVNYREPERSTEEKQVARPPKIIKRKKSQIKLLISAALIAFGIFLIMMVAATALSIAHFKASLKAFEAGDFKTAGRQIHDANFFLSFASPSINLLGQTTRVIGLTGTNVFFDNFSASSALVQIAAKDIEAISRIDKGIDKNTLDSLISDSFYFYFSAQKYKIDFSNNIIDSLLTPQLSKTMSVAPIAEKILGFNGEKNYLLLFQNNGELRPTGGFIGSIGELKVKDGAIKKLTLNDVYDFDGKLKAHVEPYYVVRRYLQPHLYLRDSNFDPDFQNSASAAALLYNLESGRKVDGVIAINYDAVKQIIGAVGPIKLTAYNKTVDENNAFEFLQNTIDNNFFPGSTQKRDVLNALFDDLVFKIGENQNSIKIARLLPKLMNEKNILFAFEQPSVQAIFSSINFGGEYKEIRPTTKDTIMDSLAVNEANIGVDKANAYLTSETSYEVDLSSNNISSKVTHTINNTSTKSKDYKAYVRFFAPLGSNLSRIIIDGQEQKIVPAITDYKTYERINFKAPAGLEVDQGTENGYQVFGFIINVPRLTKQEIYIEYANGANNISSSIFNYSLRLIKQPGKEAYPFTLNAKYNKNITPEKVDNAQLLENSLRMNRTISQDEEFTIKFIRRSNQ